MHRRGNGRSQRQEGEFPQAAGPKRPVRFGHLQDDRFNAIRNVENGRDKVGAELVGQDVTFPG